MCVSCVCVAGCSNVSDTYLLYQDFDLLGYDAKYFVDTYVSASTCQSHCTADPECRVFVRVPSDGRCFLKYVTGLEYPDRWHPQPGVDSYQRKCH